MTDKVEYLERDVNEMKIIDLKRGIAVLGGTIPQGTTLKKQIEEIFIKCRQDYITHVASQSGNTATFTSQSPEKVQEPPMPQNIIEQSFGRAHSVREPSADPHDLTLNAFEITGANMLNDQLKTQLHMDEEQFSSETQPLKPLRPPKGIERTPNYDDLESFIRPQTVIQQVELSERSGEAELPEMSVGFQGTNLIQSQAAPVSVSNFDFTTNFTQDQLTNAGLESTVQIDAKAREFEKMTISDEMRRTESQIDTLHEQMRSILANVGSPIKNNASSQEIIVPAAHDIQESEGEPIIKPKKNPKPVLKKKFTEKEINRAYKEKNASNKKPHVSPLENNIAEQEDTRSELRPEDLEFKVSARNKETAGQDATRKSFAVESTGRVAKNRRNVVIFSIVATILMLVVSIVFINAFNHREVIRIPFVTRAVQLIFAAVLPRSYYERSKTMTSGAYIIPYATYSNDGEFMRCPDDNIPAVKYDSTQISDIRFSWHNTLANWRNWILCQPERRHATEIIICIPNTTEALLRFESEQEFDNVMKKRLIEHYLTNIRRFKTELNCYINDICQIRRKRELEEVHFSDIQIDIGDEFENNEISLFLQEKWNITQNGSHVFVTTSLAGTNAHFGTSARMRLQFALKPFLCSLKIIVFLSVVIIAMFCSYKLMLAVLTQSYYKSSIEELRYLKRTSEHATIRSAQLLSKLLDGRLPDFIKEEVMSNVEKLLQLCEKVDTRYARNVFGEVEMEFFWAGGLWTERGPTSFLDNEESTHTIEY